MKTKQSIFAVLSFLSALAASPAPAVDQEMGCKICKECAMCRERMEKKMTADAPPPMKPEMKAMPPLQPGPAKPRPIAMPGMGGGPRQPFPGLPSVEKRLAEADLAAILQQYQKVRMMAEEAQTELRLMPESAPDQERVAGRLKVLRSLAEELKKRATACCDKGSKEGKPAKQNPHAGHEKPESDEKSSPAPPEAAPHH
jgi:hypothetical protein